jgi:hypothetical protein
MPRRGGIRKIRALTESIQNDPELCNLWKEFNMYKIGNPPRPYKNKKDCLAFQKKMTKTVKGKLTVNQKNKNKTNGGTRRR